MYSEQRCDSVKVAVDDEEEKSLIAKYVQRLQASHFTDAAPLNNRIIIVLKVVVWC